MRLQRTIVIYSAVASITSLCFYLAPCPTVLLSNDQMNELLLAIFGAGVSSLAIGIIEYQELKRDREDRVLTCAERVISWLYGLKPCLIENIGSDDKDARKMLCDFFDEESMPQGALSTYPRARDALIVAIEHCEQSKCSTIANDPYSHFNRYIRRSKENIEQAARSYLACGTARLEYVYDLDGAILDLHYLGENAPKWLAARLFSKQRTALHIKAETERICAGLDNAISTCRLFQSGEANHADVMRALIEAEALWNHVETSDSGEGIKEANSYAYGLFVAVHDFAKQTKSQHKHRYDHNPWQ